MINCCRLKGRLVEKGFTQKEIAKRLGIAQASVNLKLNGKRAMSLDEACFLAKILDIKPAEFSDFFFKT